MTETTQQRMPVAVIILGMVIPTLITWLYFDLLASAPAIAQKAAYAGGKLSQVGILLVAIWLWRQMEKPSPNSTPLAHNSTLNAWSVFGVLSGLVIGCTAVCVFYWVLVPLGVIEPTKIAATEKLQSMGVNTPAILIGIALFYALLHYLGHPTIVAAASYRVG